ncbi:hypothetical protein RSP795_08460 [Ralstonia solanacearum]|uniref:DUF4124 domain-containing protein n=1 Tax=Ralstonia solanacearum TaxID=305 RepID=A0AAW5ZNK1_RALSL|nr:DUF4124 domain-containing protein [Ralstonia solanacearum]MBB6595536.1 DUF4124 domain-containing protein [Ralstonia solanacearum]MDB0526260.1 DUF4124 domain-containing protein [Ralstonia solanacearum]MDB0539883.1 DUF4124 domain-containing protein [Ralstonia solanacearum]MDB0549865.1 DUF4124 domain-containing protein [Ralstonia solanacearum]MDB0557298.1 DUF4124 domain-containing protein [Ralstonia solanacearum]
MKRLHVLLPATATLIALACPVHAQWAWQWRDEKGQMVYSDVAPPPSIPASRIIRNPNGQMTSVYEALPAPASGVKAADPKAVAKPGQPASGVAATDPDAELRKRLADRAKREQEDAQKAEQAQRRQADCERLRNETAYLQGGRRYATPQADGTLSYMDDAQRAAAVQRNQSDLSANCSS